MNARIFAMLAMVVSLEGAEIGQWAFNPPRDEFSVEALWDLRSLNEKEAGQAGYLKLSADGNSISLGDGKPARLWAVNSSYHGPNLERHARFLAKRGVNMVRFHGNITSDKDLKSIHEPEREQLWRTVAAMKKQGIYVTYSPYWAGHSRLKSSMGFLDDGGASNWGLLFFDERLQEAYKEWWRQVLTPVNPHTGIPLASDPALGIVQLQNEDSLLFWTSQRIGGAAKAELRRQFGKFVTKKYGSMEAALKAWEGAKVSADQDRAADGENDGVALFTVWEMTERRIGGGFQKRVSDQLEFFTETMREFNAKMRDFIRGELKCKALINANNWRTADNGKLLDAERYSYSANEVMAVNRYFTGAHEGKNNGWAIVNGDKFTDASVLKNPREFPVALKQPVGAPMMVTESSWVPPNGYQSEGPFLVAGYQSLTGVDGFYWFATGVEDWRAPGSANGYLPSEGKWVCATPMLMGQWPATALLYRSGYLKEGEAAVREERSLGDIWDRKAPWISEEGGFDPNRDVFDFAPSAAVKDGIDPLAFLVGRVEVKLGGDARNNRAAKLDQYVDKAKRTVRSITGELIFDEGRGICLMNAPKAQGATGFLKEAGGLSMRDVMINSSNEYATVMAVSLDGKELNASTNILVQIGTMARPEGWKTKPTEIKGKPAQEVTDFGRAPWMIAKAEGTLSIRNQSLKTAHVLDANGMSVRVMPLSVTAGVWKVLELPEDALYVVLR